MEEKDRRTSIIKVRFVGISSVTCILEEERRENALSSIVTNEKHCCPRMPSKDIKTLWACKQTEHSTSYFIPHTAINNSHNPQTKHTHMILSSGFAYHCSICALQIDTTQQTRKYIKL
jgi:hypothetical protein